MSQDVSRTAESPGGALRKPPWLRARLPAGPAVERVRRVLRAWRLHTVCEEALCPNRGACWGGGHATLMILGGTCTRGCAFCNVFGGRPAPADEDEPRRVGEALRRLKLRNVVLTSVTRDDLPDGGAALWAATLRAARAAAPAAIIEALVPDFGGAEEALRTVLAAGPDILGHNLETVPSQYARVRPQADYERSLGVLRRAHVGGALVKTAVMLGLGERREEVLELMREARAAGCAILFLGQYLQPSRRHAAVARYVSPSEFEAYRAAGLELGFAVVVAGPLVRSSYPAAEQDALVAAVRRARAGAEQGPAAPAGPRSRGVGDSNRK